MSEPRPPSVTTVEIGRGHTPAPSACHAATAQIHFSPNGNVSVCCMQARPLGNVGRQSVREIWDGSRRADLVEHLGRHDYSAGCEGCGAAVEVEGRAGSYPELFEPWAPRSVDERWPRRVEFNLSNSCNLQCIHCHGELSSSIRTHRERRPPMEKAYGDDFFDQLAEFIPHLEWAQFAGGEPFLGAENYRVWDLIADLHPTLPCNVITNATQWTPRVEATVERLRMGFTFSLDAFSDDTFEAIRVGATHQDVLRNVDRYVAAAERNGMEVAVNHCLMVQNHHEFGDLLLWAEERSLPVFASVVRTPALASLAHLPGDELRSIVEGLDAQSDTVRPQLTLNRGTWDRELARLRSWSAAKPDQLVRTWPIAQHGHNPRILEFWADGDGPVDEGAARAELAAFSEDGTVHRLVIDVDNLISAVSDSVTVFDGFDEASLIGQPALSLGARFTDLLGDVDDQRELVRGPDRIDVESRFGDRLVRTSMVALRNDQGWATEAAMLFAFGRVDVAS